MSSFEMVKKARTLREFMRLLLSASSAAWYANTRDPLLVAYIYVIENYSGDARLISSNLFKAAKSANGKGITSYDISDLRKEDPYDLTHGSLFDDYETLAESCGYNTYDQRYVITRIKKITNKSHIPGKQILLELKLVVAYLG